MMPQSLKKLCRGIFLLLFLNTCSSEDLGRDPAFQVPVDAEHPTWQNGVGELLQRKCANCHNSNPSNFVPANTPHGDKSVDGLASESFFTTSTPKAQGLTYAVYVKLFMEPSNPMPPAYGTPLYDSEKIALKNFLTAKSINQDTICPPTMPASSSELTYASVKSILDTNCALSGCHSSDVVTVAPLASLGDLKKYRSKSLGYIVTGFMPLLSGKTFIAGTDGQKVWQWLCHGKEFQ